MPGRYHGANLIRTGRDDPEKIRPPGVHGGAGLCRFGRALPVHPPPPLANHYAADLADFWERLERLNDDDLRYLVGLILDGSESLGCVPCGHVEVFLTFVTDRLGRDTALSILQRYESEDGCAR
ncbi:hypothetical protein [Methanoculleus chikugoensis]|uniref:hypothetical protein n=1 Tax=Methanoculleus chikugoensis TaxID=118126 RepID=UPI001FB5203A|nr:hypothetical protein [Methanoculleus chikugoensis]